MSLPLGYFVRQGAASLARGGAMSVAAVLVLALAGLGLGGYALAWRNSAHWLAQAEQKLEAVAFHRTGSDAAQAERVRASLAALPGVREARLVSPDESARELAADLGLRDYFQILGENPLPYSTRVKLDVADPAALREWAAKARAIEGVEDVDYGQDLSEGLLRWLSLARRVTLILGLTLALAAALMTASVIRLTLYARRDEISIMRMVGASGFFIRVPFLVEGALQGLLGGLLALLALWGGAQALRSHALSDLQLDLAKFLPYGLSSLFALQLLSACALLGFLGSLLALGRGFKDER